MTGPAFSITLDMGAFVEAVRAATTAIRRLAKLLRRMTRRWTHRARSQPTPPAMSRRMRRIVRALAGPADDSHPGHPAPGRSAPAPREP